MRIDLIALDLDGTLLDSNERVSPRNRTAIRRALENGVRVVLVTGRGTELPRRVSHELNLNLPVICCHGALTKDFGANRTLVHLPVPLVQAKPLVEFAEAQKLSFAIYAEEFFWRLEGSHVLMEDMTGPAWRETNSLCEVLAQAPTFLRFFGVDSIAAIKREFGDWPLAFREETWGDFAECAVLNPAASKRNALVRLCADFQITADHVLAIGDSRNDVPMLRWAGLGVAMGNAAADVRESVRCVTGTNDRDGVALAIERFALAAAQRPA